MSELPTPITVQSRRPKPSRELSFRTRLRDSILVGGLSIFSLGTGSIPHAVYAQEVTTQATFSTQISTPSGKITPESTPTVKIAPKVFPATEAETNATTKTFDPSSSPSNATDYAPGAPQLSSAAAPAENEEAPPSTEEFMPSADVPTEPESTPTTSIPLPPPPALSYRGQLFQAIDTIGPEQGINPSWMKELALCEYSRYLNGNISTEFDKGPYWGPWQYDPITFSKFFNLQDLTPELEEQFKDKALDHRVLMKDPEVSTLVAARMIKFFGNKNGARELYSQWPHCGPLATRIALGGNSTLIISN